MANCQNYNCDDALGTYEELNCGYTLPGGASAALLLECDHEIDDPSDATQVQAAIDDGKALLVSGGSFTIEPASPQIITSKVPCRPDSVSTYTRTGTYYNPNVSTANSDLHSTIFKGRKFGGMILYECGAVNKGFDQVTWIDAQIVFTGSRVLPGSNKEEQRYEGTFSWESSEDALIYDKPAGIFD